MPFHKALSYHILQLFDDEEDAFAPPDPIQDDVSIVAEPADDAYSVESAIEKFDVLNITAYVFMSIIYIFF